MKDIIKETNCKCEEKLADKWNINFFGSEDFLFPSNAIYLHIKLY